MYLYRAGTERTPFLCKFQRPLKPWTVVPLNENKRDMPKRIQDGYNDTKAAFFPNANTQKPCKRSEEVRCFRNTSFLVEHCGFLCGIPFHSLGGHEPRKKLAEQYTRIRKLGFPTLDMQFFVDFSLLLERIASKGKDIRENPFSGIYPADEKNHHPRTHQIDDTIYKTHTLFPLVF